MAVMADRKVNKMATAIQIDGVIGVSAYGRSPTPDVHITLHRSQGEHSTISLAFAGTSKGRAKAKALRDAINGAME